jgi:alkyl hydroperoxide reductase subunit AhpC
LCGKWNLIFFGMKKFMEWCTTFIFETLYEKFHKIEYDMLIDLFVSPWNM